MIGDCEPIAAPIAQPTPPAKAAIPKLSLTRENKVKNDAAKTNVGKRIFMVSDTLSVPSGKVLMVEVIVFEK